MEKVFRIRPEPLLKAITETLRENREIELPKNHDLIKTGHGKQYSPTNPDWFYVRMASIVRHAMRSGKVSMQGLCKRYGSRKNRGVRPTRYTGASRYVVQGAINELVKIGWFDFESNKDDILTSKAKETLSEIMEKVGE